TGCAVLRMIDDLVLARERIFERAIRPERRPDAGVRSDRARFANRRKHARDALDQVAALLAGSYAVVEIAEVVVVGGADRRHVLPGHDEDLPPVDGIARDAVVREPPFVRDVNALAGANLHAPRGQFSEARRDRRPRAGCIDDDLRAGRDLSLREAIARANDIRTSI